jgi:hypothetical protein
VSYKCLKEVIRDLLKLLNRTDMVSYNCLFLLEDLDRAEDLNIHILLVLKVSKSSGQLILIFLVENDLAHRGIIINIKEDSHLLIMLGY